MRYVVIWDDGYTSTFYNTPEEAHEAVDLSIYWGMGSGRVMTEAEYLTHY